MSPAEPQLPCTPGRTTFLYCNEPRLGGVFFERSATGLVGAA
jgi:hypothetical protein